MKVNQVINIDKTKEKDYNKIDLINEATFTYYDYLKYKLFEKMQKAKNTTLHEQKEKYKRLEQQENRVNNEHDKVFRKILSDKIEVAKFLNEQLKINLKPEDIEQYNSSYINTLMQNEEADVVYKLKSKNEFFLIEHQSKVDYRMPFRILKYEMAIVESAIDEKECKKKDYLYPRVNAIVLYTGKQKWNVAKTFNEAQVPSILEKAIEFAKYILVDINNYTEEKLLETPSFMTKALLIEKAKDNEQIANYIEKIVEIINKDKNVQMITDERIRERKLGELEGHEITNEMEKKIWNYDLNYQIPKGENLHDFEKRILDFLNDIKKKYEGKTVLIVAHGGVAKVLKAHLYGMPKSKNLSEIEIKNCEIIETEI